MNATQAYRILKVRPGVSLGEIEQAYVNALRTLQLQLVPGQPMPVRHQAQDQIAELKSACEFLKNMTKPSISPTIGGAQAAMPAPPAGIPRLQPMPMPQIPPAAIPQSPPGPGLPLQPAVPSPPPSAWAPVAPSYPWIIPASLVLAVSVTLIVVWLCLWSSVSPRERNTARLRVLSVPWSYVQVDGKSLGPSGQTDPFVVRPGDHEVILRQGNRVLSRTVHLPANSETVIKVQLEKGQIHVANKRI